MRIILMSDIHGNLPALQTVADTLPEHDRVIVAGDLCLEGAQPAEVLDLLRELGWPAVMGNTDRDIVSPENLEEDDLRMVEWTRDQLGEDRLEYLASLPFSIEVTNGEGEKLLVVHANPLNFDDQLRPGMSEQELRPYLEGIDATILAFGHLHIPYVRPVDGVVLVDVSSVGHPKDRDPRSAYTVLTWDNGSRSIATHRVPYDVERTVDTMRRSGMPDAEKEIASLLKASY